MTEQAGIAKNTTEHRVLFSSMSLLNELIFILAKQYMSL
jgi:hypothetical protein